MTTSGDRQSDPERGGLTFHVLDWSGVSVDGRPIDYPRAWEIARAAPMDEHHPRCSYRQCGGGMLCDCPVLTAHPEYATGAAQDDEDRAFHEGVRGRRRDRGDGVEA